jgi:glycosyltransferase involved in cell wall biosynthesis
VRLRGLDIVCVGFAEWDVVVWTNQQHLMSRLARENRVLFVESLGLRRPQLASHDVTRILRRLSRGLSPPRTTPEGVHVLSPVVLPLHGSAAARAINRRLLRPTMGRGMRRLGLSRPLLWAYVPQAEEVLEVLDPGRVVYHCVDDIAAQQGVDATSFRAAEERFARRADLVLASAPALAERMRSLSENVLYAPNVADTSMFATALEDGPVDHALAELPRPRIVFQGAVVATKLDVSLLVSLARLRRAWSVVLVGPKGLGDPRTDVSALEQEPNVHLLGPRAYDELPAVLRGADAAIIPYAVNDLTRSVFPMKVYEYLAAGLPVVSTPLPALEGVEGVAVARDAAEMAELLGRELAADSDERRVERSRRAAGHSWESRIAEIEGALDGAG